MAETTVTAKLSGQTEDEAVGVTYDFGDTLEDAVDKFGENVVFNRVVSALTIDLQALIRRGIKAGKKPEEIQKMADEWTPGVKQISKKSPKEKVEEQLAKLSPEQRQELLKQLQVA